MSDREDAIAGFLAQTGWQTAGRRTLAGDASNRRYDRLTRADGERAVLMDAPPEKGEDVRPFVAVSGFLASLSLSAPAILAADEEQGFLLLEDLGDDVYARVMERSPERCSELYAAAVDVLCHLHQAPAPGWMAAYDSTTMTTLAALSYDWYLRGAGPGREPDRHAFIAAMNAALAPLEQVPPVAVLRDYHAENLIWLPERNGVARVGLLDFQDARAGHPAYDLVSLAEDARRDVSPPLRDEMLSSYAARTGIGPKDLRYAVHALGAQRNLRILGVFARLSLRDGKRHYVDLIPRVWTHLMRDLSHPDLSTLRRAVLDDLPPPEASLMKALKNQCATAPVQ